MNMPTIGVTPETALIARPRLFAALGEAFDVTFVAGSSHPGAEGLVVFGNHPVPARCDTVVLAPGQEPRGNADKVELSDSDALHRALRGWAISDQGIAGQSVLLPGKEAVLAHAGNLPIWTTTIQDSYRVDRTTAVPDELDQSETLASRFRLGRFFGLLPLLHFTKRIRQMQGWHDPPFHASLMMDDPNLHSHRYGYLDLEAVVREAKDELYHLSVATVPLDTWLISSRAADLFRRNPEQLSLLVHGNDHTRHELGTVRGAGGDLRVAAQAVRRIRQVELRHDLTVDRVMAAPHGRCSEAMAEEMCRVGFESLCISRPLPWLPRPPGDSPLAGWHPADTSARMPILPRISYDDAAEVIPLRAFLGHPIIPHGHHWDLADEPSLFARWARDIGRLGDVSWGSVGSISRAMVSWRVQDRLLQVRPHTRSVELAIPAEADHVAVHWPFSDDRVELVHGGRAIAEARPGETIALPQASRIGIRLRSPLSIDPEDVRSPRWSAWPITRRFAVEARDRFMPRVDRWRHQRHQQPE